ncbi:MAG TPA: hypothetical protein VJR06_08380 [Nitrososphaerales archaeon]|nr:hypothetical protein [Nitrososphaerales archaeon]
MTSPRRSQGKPIESVALKIVFRAGKDAGTRIKKAVPSAKLRGGTCEVRVDGEQPGEVAERAKDILEAIRSAL